MQKEQKIIETFNTQDSLLVITSFPEQNGELAKENAVAWYTHQVISHLPKDQKVVVICEKRNSNDQAWKLSSNVLVVPTFQTDSAAFFAQTLTQTKMFNNVANVLIQFEFNSFKNNLITGGLPVLLAGLKSQKKKITFAIHQVIEDVSALAGHLQITPNSLKAKTINTAIRSFYRSLNVFADQVIVFDEELRQRLAKYVNEDRIQVIPMGTEDKPELVDKKTARQHFSIGQDSFVVLAFGYHSWYKGTDWIVREVGNLAKQHPERKMTLLLAGSKSPTVENLTFEKTLKQALAKHKTIVVETGYLNDEFIPHCFAAADVVVLPYRAMMSSSGTLSHALSFEKPFFVSEHLAPIFKHVDFSVATSVAKVQPKELIFKMNSRGFRKQLSAAMTSMKLQKKLKKFSKTLKSLRSWKSIANKYMNVIEHQYVVPDIQQSIHARLPELSVFFPLYNEAENVRRLVHHAMAALPKIAKKFEVILVNDGSTDGTDKIANTLAKKYRAVRVVHQPNGGYGRALRTGFESAKYDWVFFSDGDLQFDLNELALFLPHATAYDAVIGYRKNRADSFKRLMLANMLKIWNKVFFSFPSGIKDIDCAFKLFHKKVVGTIFPLQSYGAMISTEMLLKTIDSGFNLKQIGVTHLPRQFGEPTGAKPHVIIGAVKETFMIVRSRWFGTKPVFAQN
jgi:glycosyltransferase involved in cell wall biosynthesis